MNFIRWAMLAALVVTICSITSLPAQDLTPTESLEPQEIKPLPGGLSETPLFNSNNPEVVQSEGILLSTFSPAGKAHKDAHLNYSFTGNFGIFSHHIARPFDNKDRRPLYQGLLLHNPGDADARVEVKAGASYLSQPDSPFIELPAMIANPRGKVHAGPGSRVADDVMRGRKPKRRFFDRKLTIEPGETVLLAKLPIPAGKFDPPLNGRSTLIHLEAKEGKVQVADVAVYGEISPRGKDVEPDDQRFFRIAVEGDLAGPRERAASAPGKPGPLIYGRVAGVSKGTLWQYAGSESEATPIKNPGEQFSFVISALERGSFGTGQDQAAPLMVRYPESAYRAHGNYGLLYDLQVPLKNCQSEDRDVEILLQTPLKADKNEGGLKFATPPYKPVFFRGTVRITYPDRKRKLKSKHFHLVQHRGERGTPLASIHIPAGQTRTVRVQFVYPPDATPPQVLTVKTVK